MSGNEAGTTDDTIDPRTGLPYAASPTNPSQGLLGGFHLNVPQPSAVPFNQTYAGHPAPYADNYAQIGDALGMAGRYSQSNTWGNAAGRYAFGTGAAYGNPSGHNAPWFVTGANGVGGTYPGATIGDPSSQPYHVPAFNGGLLGGGQPTGGQPTGGQPNQQPAGVPHGDVFPPPANNGSYAPGGYTPTPAPPGTMGSGGPAGMPANQRAQKAAMNAQQANALSLLPQYQALQSDPQRAAFLRDNVYFTQQAMLKGLLSPGAVNGLAAGNAPYVGAK